MSKITITMDLDDEYADPDHKMGVTEEGYEGISEALSGFGTNIDVSAA